MYFARYEHKALAFIEKKSIIAPVDGNKRHIHYVCAHHKISLTNAVSLRNFSATRSLARSVAFSLPPHCKDFHTKPDAPCGFLLHKTNGCICRILCTYSHFIISNKSMDYTLLFPYEFQNATAVHQPCQSHRLCLSSAPQKLYSHAAPS